MYIEAFTSHFGALTDARQSAKVTYPLEDILFITLCAVTAGAQGWSDIRDYAEGHQEWFERHGFLRDGIPVDDTIARTISRIDPEQFRLCFVSWMQDVHEATQGQVIAIDGKTLRRSYQRGDKHSTIHMVNAFSCANKLVLGQVKTAAKSNEITAIPELIELLDIDGTLVSIDAMGCQTDIAQQIVDKGGDYLFTLKSNHKKLYSAVVAAFAKEREEPLGDIRIENKHGRVEARIFHVLSADRINEDFPQWPGLKTLGMSVSYRQLKGKPAELTYRYHISSAELSEREMADAVRAHWSVENSLHWVLDVSLREDDCQIHQNHGAENWSMLRHMALNMLRAESSKGSIPAKQKRAWMKAEYLEAVLSAGFSEMVN
ncbi:ISAs1 family transposase [Aliidiomarina sanyensis]|uniref:ISAs1 family transposase n=1 Tax=Aliidiomarina sanyensis TaxID=1249555 RepID=A0A432W4X7_9GAMM|nr:ISAs1 family transposase [Aliidiomarina sanyensis]RUO24716.1 ISAs1 family transposase [Aliidiomarina sanyensis]